MRPTVHKGWIGKRVELHLDSEIVTGGLLDSFGWNDASNRFQFWFMNTFTGTTSCFAVDDIDTVKRIRVKEIVFNKIIKD